MININGITKEKVTIKAYWMIGIILVLTLFYGVLHDEYRVPSAIRYIHDIMIIFMLIFYFYKMRKIKYSKELNPIMIWLIVYFIYNLIGYLLNYQSVFYLFYGLRNNFRYFVYFILCIFFLKRINPYKFLSFLDMVFVFNIFVMLNQYFFKGLDRDLLGGIFGTTQGCNGILNIFFVIMSSKELILYLNKKTNLLKVGFICGASLLLSSVAELKFFYIEFVIIITYVILRTDFTWKKIFIIIGALVGLYFGITILNKLFHWEKYLSIEGFLFLTRSGGYSERNSLLQVNRLNFISVLNRLYLKTQFQRLFGLGIGNCEYSGASLFLTPFNRLNASSSYTWLMTAHTYLEQGIIGLFLYLLFFVIVFICIYKHSKQEVANQIFCQWGELMAILSMLLVFYNQTMREEGAFLVYFVLALPFACYKNVYEENRSVSKKLNVYRFRKRY